MSIADGLYVANCWTQEYYGNDGGRYGSVPALRTCITKAFDFCEEYGLELKTPKIASERAGLDWDTEVHPIFDEFEKRYPDVVVKLFIYQP